MSNRLSHQWLNRKLPFWAKYIVYIITVKLNLRHHWTPLCSRNFQLPLECCAISCSLFFILLLCITTLWVCSIPEGPGCCSVALTCVISRSHEQWQDLSYVVMGLRYKEVDISTCTSVTWYATSLYTGQSMNKGCCRVKHGNKGWPAKKQENNVHPGLDTTNNSPCSAHVLMHGKTSGCQVELFDQHFPTTWCPLHHSLDGFHAQCITKALMLDAHKTLHEDIGCHIICLRLIVPLEMHSQMKWYHMSMCLVAAWLTGFQVRRLATQLSMYRVVGVCVASCSLNRSCHNQTNSLVAWQWQCILCGLTTWLQCSVAWTSRTWLPQNRGRCTLRLTHSSMCCLPSWHWYTQPGLPHPWCTISCGLGTWCKWVKKIIREWVQATLTVKVGGVRVFCGGVGLFRAGHSPEMVHVGTVLILIPFF